MEQLIKPVQVEIGQQRRDHSALWRSLFAPMQLGRIIRAIAFFDDQSLQPHPDQLQHAPIGDSLLHTLEKILARNRVEVRLKIRVVHLPPPFLEIGFYLLQGLMGRSSGTKAERTVQHIRLEDRLNQQQEGHLHHAILDRRDAQWPHLAIGFGDVHTLHRRRPVGLAAQFLFNLTEESGYPVLGLSHLLDTYPVHARCSIVGRHQVPGRLQHVAAVNRFIQTVEAESRLRPPNAIDRVWSLFPLGFEV